MRAKRCKSKPCGIVFTPRSPMQCACSPLCAMEIVRAKKEQAETKARQAARKQDRAKRESLKTRSDYIKETQIAVNRYCRLRDAGKGCISCGASLALGGVGGGFDAGHFRSRGAAPHLRFDLRNIHGQCKRCNNQLAGNATEYRRGLIERFGLQYVEALEADQEPRRHTPEEMAEIRKLMKQMEKQL